MRYARLLACGLLAPSESEAPHYPPPHPVKVAQVDGNGTPAHMP